MLRVLWLQDKAFRKQLYKELRRGGIQRVYTTTSIGEEIIKEEEEICL